MDSSCLLYYKSHIGMNIKSLLGIILLTAIVATTARAQFSWDDDQGCLVDSNGECVGNPVNTALPFMSIIPDARGGAMGDVGLTTSADSYSNYYNPSKLAFVQKDSELAATYTPWLRAIGLTDVYVAYLGGYKKIDDLQAVGFNLGYFNLGEIQFTDIDGNTRGTGRPREFAVGVSYARKLSENFSAGIGGKFFNSSLAPGQTVSNQPISDANGFAADISMTYQTNPNLEETGNNMTIALALSNLGSKVSYTNNQQKEFIPTNLGLGIGYEMATDDYNKFNFSLEFNKLLVPTRVPNVEPFISNGDYQAYLDRLAGSTFSNVLSSFSDAPGGLKEELQEISISLGAEYWYNDQFALRAGYYRDHPLKGDRQFLTVGLGLKYNVFGFDVAYLAPTNAQRSPLDNTLRFGFTFDFGADFNAEQ